MAVQEQTPYIEYVGNGTTKVFPLTFDCEGQDHLIITINGDEPIFGSWLLIDGSVSFKIAPLSDSKIIFQRNSPFERTSNYSTYNNSFRPEPVNKDFDRIWWKLQEMGLATWLLSLKVDKEIRDRIAADIYYYTLITKETDQKVNELKEYIEALVNNITGNDFLPILDEYIKTWSGQTQREKNKEIVSLADFGCASGGADNSLKVSNLPTNKPIYVGVGAWHFNNRVPPNLFYGDGTIVVSGYVYKLDKKIPTYVTNSASIELGEEVMTGYATTEQYVNLYAGQASGESHTSNCRANTGFGYRTLQKAANGTRLTAVGKGALAVTTDGYSSTAFGCDALGQGKYTNRNSALGDNALKWFGASDPVGTLHDFHMPYDAYGTDPLVGYGLTARWPTIRTDLMGTNYSTPNPANLPTSTTDASQSVAVGRNALLHSIKGTENTAVGYNALAHAYVSSRNTALGRGAGRDCLVGSDNLFIGYHSGIQQMSGNYNVLIGGYAGCRFSHTDYITAIGYNAMRNATSNATKPTEKSTGMRRAVAIGNDAMSSAINSSFSVAIGNSAAENTKSSNIVAVGSTALKAGGGNYSVAVGSQSLSSAIETSVGNAALGYQAGLAVTSGTYNTLTGYQAGLALTNQNFNTFIGTQAGTTSNFNNCSIVGYGSQTLADNQVQLGNSTTTTYTYGAVQNRSDSRDKSNIEAMPDAMLDFVLNLRSVQGVWDMRDDYVSDLFPLPETPIQPNYVDIPELIKDNSIEHHAAVLANAKFKKDYDFECRLYQKLLAERQEQAAAWWSNPVKDGSKKRNRKHNWFIAQEVKILADNLGIDFAGLQHFEQNGGMDAYSLGYEEFIPPIVTTLQKAWSRIGEIEARLERVEKIHT